MSAPHEIGRQFAKTLFYVGGVPYASLDAAGLTLFSGIPLVVGGNLTVTGTIALTGNATVTGNYTIDGTFLATGQIQSAADIISSSATLASGYTAGGAYTQSTNKSTTVTAADTPCGNITTAASSLADNTTVTFQVNCAAVINAAYSGTVTHQSGGTGGNYIVWAHSFAAGLFKVSIRNLSGGPLSDALVLHYQIHRGANSIP